MSRPKENRPQIVTYGYPFLGSSRVRQAREFARGIVIAENVVESVDTLERGGGGPGCLYGVLRVQHDAKVCSHRTVLELETLERLCMYGRRTRQKTNNADEDDSHRTPTTPA